MERRTTVPARAAPRWRRPRMFAFRWLSLGRMNAWRRFRPDRASADEHGADTGENYTAGALAVKCVARKPAVMLGGSFSGSIRAAGSRRAREAITPNLSRKRPMAAGE